MTEQPPKNLSEDLLLIPFLVAEPNEALRKSIVNILSEAGVKNCGAVADGAQAWQAWRHSKDIGVIVADWELPEMDSLEILKRIRSDKLATFQPVFAAMMTDGRPELLEQAVNAGADCVIIKPFPRDQLISLILEGVSHRMQIAGDNVFSEYALERAMLKSKLRVDLVFERYRNNVECVELTPERCVLVVDNNYGLGTVLNMAFAREEPGVDAFYQPIKGTATKIERIPQEYGTFKVHIKFNMKPKEQHGIKSLLAAGQQTSDGQ